MSDTLTHDASTNMIEGYDRLRQDCGVLSPIPFALIALKGDDRKGWLQGQVTNDLRSLDLGASSAFCMCAPTGHLLSVCDVWGVRDQILMTCPLETAPAVMRRIEQMVILEDVQGEDLTPGYTLVSIQGPTATKALGELMHLPSLDAGESRFEDIDVFCLRSNRTGFGGWDVWLPASASKQIERLRSAFAPVPEDAYDVARLEAGIPNWGRDMNERTLPPELGPHFENRHISYSKGCYTGQEVLMRIHSRGHTNKTWVGLYSDELLESGANVSHAQRRDAGAVTSVGDSPDYGPIGAAILRNEAVSNGEVVQVETSRGTVEAEVRLMPLLRLD